MGIQRFIWESCNVKKTGQEGQEIDQEESRFFLWCYLNLNTVLKLYLKAGYSVTLKAKVGGVIYDYPGEQENGALIFVLIYPPPKTL